MSEQAPFIELLSLITAPAFSVRNGIIAECNDGAKRLLFPEGNPIADLLMQNQTAYADFKDGCLYLTLQHNGRSYSTSVMHTETADLFIVEEENDRAELRTLSLTAASMRQPLSDTIATAANLAATLEQTKDPGVQAQLQHMNRNLCRMHRMLCNMSDALQYADGNPNNLICQNIVSVVESIFQRAQQLCSQSGMKLVYTVPRETILCAIDESLLERAIYNMLSNAMKFSSKGSVIEASLIRIDKRVQISIKDHGNGIPDSILSNVFSRYQRLPGLEDARLGLGLGLVLVRCAARVHDGTVLIDQPENNSTRVTISFPIRQSAATLVRSTVARLDYAGGWDHGLLELSDVMPADLY